MKLQRLNARASALSALGLLGVVALIGCVDSNLQAPTVVGANSSGKPSIVQNVTPVAVSFVRYATPITPATTIRTIGSGGGTITTTRFTLTIPAGAISAVTAISLNEVNVNQMQVQIEPTGLAFATPATLAFNYTGTSADPASPNYIPGGTLMATWFDPSTSLWTNIGGSDNSTAKTFTTSLNHLSYYALAK